MANTGYKNEYSFMHKINSKKLNELDFLIQEMVLFLFPNIHSNDIIYCYKNVEYEKGDICIRVGQKIKYISIKMGHRNSVHCEKVSKFVRYLEGLNIKSQTINEILKYQYADGTIDGTGTNRLSTEEYKKDHMNSINHINEEINTEKIIEESINRFLIQGTQWHVHKIDLLVYGTPEDFFFITPQEIYTYIKSKINTYSSAIHFSCLTFQPLSRVLNYNEKLEYMRDWIQIKWYNLEDNIFEILNNRMCSKKI